MEYLFSLSSLSWHNVGGVILAYYFTLAFYRLFLHPLARFPGPRLAAISRWYEGYYDPYLGGQYTPKILDMHKQYGRPLLVNGAGNQQLCLDSDTPSSRSHC